MAAEGKVILCMVVALLVLGSTFGVASLVIWSKNSDNPCLGGTSLIGFSYLTWLLWTGITILVGQVVELLLLGLYLHADNNKNDGLAMMTWISAAIWMFLYGCFSVAWYVVGAILYFKEVANNCPTGQNLHDYALALFIIQTVGIGCAVLCRPVMRVPSA